MATIAFIGLGNMGGGMAANLAKAGHDVRAFDLSEDALDKAVEAGCSRAASAAEAIAGADTVVTMLPAGKHVAGVYENDVFGNAATGTLLLDCAAVLLTAGDDFATRSFRGQAGHNFDAVWLTAGGDFFARSLCGRAGHECS